MNLKDYMRLHGLSYKDMVALTGISNQQLRNIADEYYKCGAQQRTVDAISRATNGQVKIKLRTDLARLHRLVAAKESGTCNAMIAEAYNLGNARNACERVHRARKTLAKYEKITL
jgi:DNA-binding transcriptional regulator YdaS (Cro superfamily)